MSESESEYTSGSESESESESEYESESESQSKTESKSVLEDFEFPIDFKELAMGQIKGEVDKLKILLSNASQQHDEHDEQLTESRKKILDAIGKISESTMDAKTKIALIEDIQKLQGLLAKETQFAMKVTKYHQLADMLHCVVVDNNATLADKSQSMTRYLEAFRIPPSRFAKYAKIACLIGVLAVGIGLLVASFFVIPMIPVASAFAFIGLTGATLTAATTITSVALQFGSVFIACKIAEKIFSKLENPLATLMKHFSKEYKTASKIEGSLRKPMHQSFFKAQQTAKSDGQAANEKESEQQFAAEVSQLV